ncbi:FtsX-like permease family protein [candidate division GN15 bacterium]|nr:FtsX-like permease family protein [candidate division GN15 bacterium]
MIIKVALRNVFRQKRRSLLTILTMLGGFALAAVSISWGDGTYAHVIRMFTRNQLGHIQVHEEGYLDQRSLYKTIEDYQQIGDRIAAIDGVIAWAPRLFAAGLASVDEKASAVQVTGVDPQLENAATRFDQKVSQGRTLPQNPEHTVLLGQGLARRLEASIGDSLVIVSNAADGSIANDIYLISGIVESGNSMSDQLTLYMHLADAQELFWLQARVHELAVIVNHLDDVDPLTAQIQQQLPDDLVAASWKEFARSFYVAMQADKRGSYIALGVVLLVVAVGVLNTVLMTVLERRREYGMLRAIGTTPLQIVRMVIWEVLCMAVIGIAGGIVVAYAVAYYLLVEGIPMPQPFTWGGVEFTHMYAQLSPHVFWVPALAVVLTALVVSLFPAMRAANVAPAKVMRLH